LLDLLSCIRIQNRGDIVNIKIPSLETEQEVKIYIRDLQGKVLEVLSKVISNYGVEVTLPSMLPNGIYLIGVEQENLSLSYQKLLILR